MIPTIDLVPTRSSPDPAKRQMMARLIGCVFWTLMVGLVCLSASLFG